MPKITLELNVTETGVKVSQVVGEAEKALARLKETSSAAGQGMQRLGDAHDRSNVSMRDTKQAIGALTTAFGALNPGLSFAVLELSHFGSALSGLPVHMAAVSGALVAAGAGISYLVSRFQEIDKATEFQVRLNDSVRRFDTSGMVGQLKQVSLELEILEKKAATGWRAMEMMKGGPEAGPAFEGTTGTLGEVTLGSEMDELKAKRDALRQAIEKTISLPFEQDILKASARIHAAQSARAPLTGPTAMADLTSRVQAEETAAKRMIDILKEIATAQASTEQERTRIAVAASFDRLAVAEEAKNKILAGERAIAAANEGVRAQLAQAQAEQRQAQIDVLRTQVEPIDAKNDADAAWRLSQGLGVTRATYYNPAALQLIEAERASAIAAIEEALAKQLAAIQQVAVADEARIQLVAAAQATADAKRLAALEAALGKENALAATIETKYQAALTKAGESIKKNITTPFDEAMAKVETLAAGVSGVGGGSDSGSGAPGGGSQPGQWRAWKQGDSTMFNNQMLNELGIPIPANIRAAYNQADWWTRTSMYDELKRAAGASRDPGASVLADPMVVSYHPGPIVGASGIIGGYGKNSQVGLAAETVKLTADTVNVSGGYGTPGGDWGEPGGGYGTPGGNWGEPDDTQAPSSLAAGGVVPGPIGAPRRAIVHGGEVITPRGRGGDLVIHFSLDGHAAMKSLRIPLQDAIRNGQVQVRSA